jgi:hypothetical protein
LAGKTLEKSYRGKEAELQIIESRIRKPEGIKGGHDEVKARGDLIKRNNRGRFLSGCGSPISGRSRRRKIYYRSATYIGLARKNTPMTLITHSWVRPI